MGEWEYIGSCGPMEWAAYRRAVLETIKAINRAAHILYETDLRAVYNDGEFSGFDVYYRLKD